MQKNKTSLIMGLFILGVFAVYSIVLFVLMGFAGHHAGYWVSYAFVCAAFGLIALFNCRIFADKKPFRYWFLGFPIIRWSVIYIAASVAIGLLFMFVNSVALAAVVQILLMAAYIFIGAMCYFQKAQIVEVDDKKEKLSYIRILSAELNAMAKIQKDEPVKARILSLAEAVRFSDPISHDLLVDIEEQIRSEVAHLKMQLDSGRKDEALITIERAHRLLTERNELCKANKHL